MTPDGFCFSPDSRWFAYSSNDSGRYEIYIHSVTSGEKRRVSIDGGMQPSWRRDGKELFFVTQDGKLMAAEVKPGPDLRTGVPELFLQSNLVPVYTSKIYSSTGDGTRFLMSEPGKGGSWEYPCNRALGRCAEALNITQFCRINRCPQTSRARSPVISGEGSSVARIPCRPIRPATTPTRSFRALTYSTATVLATAVEKAEEIDVQRAEAALRKAQEPLADPHVEVGRWPRCSSASPDRSARGRK